MKEPSIENVFIRVTDEVIANEIIEREVCSLSIATGEAAI
jgi:hypothetical protein